VLKIKSVEVCLVGVFGKENHSFYNCSNNIIFLTILRW